MRAGIVTAQEFCVDEPWRREHMMCPLLPKDHLSKCVQDRYRTVTIRGQPELLRNGTRLGREKQRHFCPVIEVLEKVGRRAATQRIPDA